MDMSFAACTGPIPEAFGALSELKELYISDNMLTGAFFAIANESGFDGLLAIERKL